MKLYLIAGEASGDLHGSNLIKALLKQDSTLECRAWGGDRMEQAGARVVKHYRNLAFMGFWEVIKNLRTILRNMTFCKEDIDAFQPDAIVLIDYPGFNLRIAQWAKQRGYRVIYYISPQIWAWHQSRVHQIQRDVDKMLVILPFETEFYKKFGVEATFVGHPLLDVIETPADPATRDDKLIALLPGSRDQELRRILPAMLSVVPDFPGYRFVVAAAESLPETTFRELLADHPQVELVFGQTYELLRRAGAALVKSGTSTLETALHGTPEVVCYAGNPLSYAIARRLVNIQYISLVNLIMDRPLVRELIQHELNRENLRASLQEILDPAHRTQLQKDYEALRHKLGDKGASERAAGEIIGLISI
jgi:lipid-A-disaccharide synthase